MNGVGRLTKNELIKIFGQLSWKIITGLILVLALLGPILTLLLNNFLVGMSAGTYYQDYYDQLEDGMEKEYYGVYLEVEKLFEENKITYDNWRYDAYYYDYEDLAMTVRAFELVKNGKDAGEVFEWFYVNDGKINVDYDDSTGEVKEVTYYDEGIAEFVPLTDEIVNSVYEEKKAELEDLKNEILTGTVATFAEYYIGNLESEVKFKQENYDEAKKNFEKDKDEEYEYKAASYDLKAAQITLDIWNVVKDASKDDEKWLISTARTAMGYGDKGAGLATLNREDFEKEQSYVDYYGNYDNYRKLTEIEYNDNLAALEVLKHSAEKGIPMADMQDFSVRTSIITVFTDNASTILLMCMILAASMMASEHMSGTVRLLLIRPRARWKILLSKIFAVVIYGAMCFVAANVLSVALVFIISGAGDISVPMLIYKNGAVTEVSVWAYTAYKTAVCSLPGLLVASIALLLSVVTKKVVFAVTIPMLINMFGSVASSLTMLFYTKLPIVEWTLLPYFAIDGFTTDVVQRTSGYYYGYDPVSMGFRLEVGVILFAVSIVVVTAVSFLVFKRQQVKN